MKQVTRKITIKEIENLDTKGLFTLGRENTQLIDFFNELINLKPYNDGYISIGSGKVVTRFNNKPNIKMITLENKPDLWLFEDDTITWLIFSDGRKKNCFKGTSIEYTEKGKIHTYQEILTSLKSLLALINYPYN